MQGDERRFSWHPTYAGKTVDHVRAELLRDLEHDQRSYTLAMSAPDEQESAILVRVVELERRWGVFHMDWATAEPGPLVDRIVDFEWRREERQELVPFHEPRPAAAKPTSQGDPQSRPPWWAFWRR